MQIFINLIYDILFYFYFRSLVPRFLIFLLIAVCSKLRLEDYKNIYKHLFGFVEFLFAYIADIHGKKETKCLYNEERKCNTNQRVVTKLKRKRLYIFI